MFYIKRFTVKNVDIQTDNYDVVWVNTDEIYMHIILKSTHILWKESKCNILAYYKNGNKKLHNKQIN